MFDLDKFGSKFFAAAFSLAVTASVFATAIIEATPNGAIA